MGFCGFDIEKYRIWAYVFDFIRSGLPTRIAMRGYKYADEFHKEVFLAGDGGAIAVPDPDLQPRDFSFAILSSDASMIPDFFISNGRALNGDSQSVDASAGSGLESKKIIWATNFSSSEKIRKMKIVNVLF